MKKNVIPFEQRCHTSNCSNQAKYKSHLCHACYQSIRYHVRLGVTHIMEWSARLDKFAARRDSILSSRKRARAHS